MSPEPTPFDLRHDPDRRRSKLARTSGRLLIAGGSLLALSIPLGLASGAVAGTTCPPDAMECWTPLLVGGGTTGFMVLAGGALALSGGIGFTVDAVRRAQDRKMELSVSVGPNQLVLAGTF